MTTILQQRIPLFPAHVLEMRWDRHGEFRDELVRIVLDRRDTATKAYNRTNQGGWSSKRDLPRWPEEPVRELVKFLAQCGDTAVREWRENVDQPSTIPPWQMSAWANVSPANAGHHRLHEHSWENWHWSGAYYLDMAGIYDGEEDLGGGIEFEDHWMGVNLAETQNTGARRRHLVRPQEGTFVMFPSWLAHRVQKHGGSRPRISFGVNMQNPALEFSRPWEGQQPALWRVAPGLMGALAKRGWARDFRKGFTPEEALPVSAADGYLGG
ncbi:MAG: putative 2OG-Fe(II) oxygenase [Pacificimonas sp.]